MQAESGLATVTLMGVMLANQRRIPVRHVVEFNEHLGVQNICSRSEFDVL